MTFMLILGAAAGLYLIWLLFRLAALALPLGTGIALALELQGRGYGIGAALATAFLAGLLLHLAGRHLYAHGGHGFGVREARGTLALWPRLAVEWIRAHAPLPADGGAR